MIGDLDKTLETLLKQELLQVTNLVISFETPSAEFDPPRPAIDLFLYDIRENRELRSNECHVERNAPRVTRMPPPVRVDCSYLVTAWAGPDDKGIEEHDLLGRVMKALLRHPTLPAAVLQGSLAGQEPPLPTASLQPGRLQSMGEFWQAIGSKPKAALHYTVTISVPVGEPVDVGPRVTDKMLKFRLEKEVAP